MKESKFIELLNLYVDHHISPADAALLEAEVRANPDHRRVYRQYCQMQKACTQLGDAFRSDSPAPAVPSKTIDFNPRRKLALATYAAGFAAVAACVAVTFVMRARFARAGAHPDSVAQVVAAAPANVSVARNPAARPALHPAFGPRSLNLREQNAELADAATAEQVAFADWINDVRFSSMNGVSPDDLRFDGRAPLRTEPRTYQSGRPFQGKVEMTAFKFQR
ncbi:MAG: putative transrane anti-sigma factor [Verrucomicrobia bacterium]|nr:putative transrane anti-sigma factor [Verrucomicrobiota bacterium]